MSKSKPNTTINLNLFKVIGPIATPDVIIITPGLPKTRSGKIMRRILRKIACHEEEQLGDVSTLADPDIVPKLIKLRDAVSNGFAC